MTSHKDTPIRATYFKQDNNLIFINVASSWVLRGAYQRQLSSVNTCCLQFIAFKRKRWVTKRTNYYKANCLWFEHNYVFCCVTNLENVHKGVREPVIFIDKRSRQIITLLFNNCLLTIWIKRANAERNMIRTVICVAEVVLKLGVSNCECMSIGMMSMMIHVTNFLSYNNLASTYK